MHRRRAGILLHVTSLPGPMQQGVLDEEAHAFIDHLAAHDIAVWQFLPLGPTHGHGSPYESLSSFAGNPELIDLKACVQAGWLSQTSLEALLAGSISEDDARREAAAGFWQAVGKDAGLGAEVDAFRRDNADWLDDFALFMALKRHYRDAPWWQWPPPLRQRQPAALAAARKQHEVGVRQAIFEQFAFARQWQALRQHAEARNILLFGDVPIYVAHDSADVWSRRHFFTVNSEGLCEEVAGVPPDYFSATGQRWGNPLYRWDKLEADGFAWWIRRLQLQLERMHVARIDHFRGLEAYWAIPAASPDGRTGEWRPAPGKALLKALAEAFGALPLVAEDLGLITPAVHALRRAFGLPGMKILQFAFGGDADNPYLPHNHEAMSVVYTGTHDNDTTLGWWRHVKEPVRRHVLEYLGISEEDMPWPLIRSALASVARLAVVPSQDVLGLGSEARLNTPATVQGNWSWRLSGNYREASGWPRFRAMLSLYGRCLSG